MREVHWKCHQRNGSVKRGVLSHQTHFSCLSVWIHNGTNCRESLQISMFLGTIPMALCTIINGTVLIAGPRFGSWVATLVFTLWWIDVALTVASSFAIPLLMFHIHELALETMTAVWLLPIVPCVGASASGGVVATILTPSWAIGVILVSRDTFDALANMQPHSKP